MRDEREMICINTLEVKAIPINWTMTNLQNLFYIKAGGDAKPEYYVEKQDKEHPYPVYTNSKDAYSTYAYTSIPIFEGNTITVSGRGAIGQAFYREKPYDAIIRLLSLSPKLKIEPKYYTYWINNVTQILSYSTVIGQLSAQQLAPYKAAVPSLYEQQLIAHYLDERCSKIDTIIAEAKVSIEEYKELKQAVIYEAVTKGLDKNVKLKSVSSLEVELIPVDWQWTNFQNLFYIKAGGDAKPELYSDKKNDQHPYPVYTNSKDKDATYAYTSVPMFEANTITVSGRGEIGTAFYREEPYDAIIRLLSLSPKLKLDSRYYTYWINNVTQIVSYSTVIGQLSAQQLAPYKTAVPSFKEQYAIANYLDKYCLKIENLINEKQSLIEDLEAYKKSLIYEVVTGKRKVVA